MAAKGPTLFARFERGDKVQTIDSQGGSRPIQGVVTALKFVLGEAGLSLRYSVTLVKLYSGDKHEVELPEIMVYPIEGVEYKPAKPYRIESAAAE